MSIRLLRTLLLTLLVVALYGCVDRESPQDVTAAFWQAVVDGDADAVADLSTLKSPEKYDAFDQQWADYYPSWGRVVIDERKATVETTLAGPGKSGADERAFTTHLVLRDGGWLVDYDRTERSINGGLFGGLFDKVTEMGKDLKARFDGSSDALQEEMDRLNSQLEQAQSEMHEYAQAALDRYAEQLNQAIEALEQSLRRTLDDQQEALSSKEQQVLASTSGQLQHSRDLLAARGDDQIGALREAGQAFADAQARLAELSNDALRQQQKEWRRIAETLSGDVSRAMGEMRDSD